MYLHWIQKKLIKNEVGSQKFGFKQIAFSEFLSVNLYHHFKIKIKLLFVKSSNFNLNITQIFFKEPSNKISNINRLVSSLHNDVHILFQASMCISIFLSHSKIFSSNIHKFHQSHAHIFRFRVFFVYLLIMWFTICSN